MLNLNIDTIHEGYLPRIKDREKALIFHTLCTTKVHTRKALADSLNLRPITVSKIVRELIEDALVLEIPPKNRTGKGRPEIKLGVNHSSLTAAAISVTSRNITGSLIDLTGKIRDALSIDMQEQADNSALLHAIHTILKRIIRDSTGSSTLSGIGIALPGTVHTEQKVWASSSRWPNMKNLHLKDLDTPGGIPVVLYRFMDPELEFILSQDKSLQKGNTLLFHWGYGIGSAVAVDGRVITSAAGRFGEIGHWKVTLDSPKKCRCGSFGCLETEAALWTLLPEIKGKFPDAPEDEAAFALFLQRSDAGEVDSIGKALRYSAISLANLCKIFYPERIFLKGPFFHDRSLYNRFTTIFFDQVPGYGAQNDPFSVVDDSSGSPEGSVYHLFRSRLRPLLKTRSNV